MDGLSDEFAKGRPRRDYRSSAGWLKKGGPRRLAEAEATTHELMSVSGHWTLAQLQVYTEEVNRKKLADSRDQ